MSCSPRTLRRLLIPAGAALSLFGFSLAAPRHAWSQG